MIVSHKRNVNGTKLESPEVKNALMKVLISPKEGWEGHVMRIIELEEGGYSPRHTHPWPHINYIISGKGILHLDGEDNELEAGSFAYVPAGKLHQFKNNGSEKFEFICIVPEEGHK
ncbi:cupin domain-containing protein [Sporosalibacterium faouarense]|uniref:cupin domain-containing protein n=1 Tax=Sporosalibacterium faouarense TaxID=516123 RepID=UPI00141C4345|nr:cupin domain-containing protein [Sporosalibacterium faouarense]MTI46433.1 cupin domain-containing protein [Bacillota bacterium]